MRANESKSPPRSTRGHDLLGRAGPRSSSTIRLVSTSLVGHEVLGVLAEDPVHLARPRDLVAADVPVPRAELGEPLRLGQPALGAAPVRDVDAGAVEPARDPSGPIVAAARQCRIRSSPSRRLIRRSRSIGASPASAATVATRTGSRSSSWMSSCTSSARRRLLGRNAVEAAELGRPLQLAGLRRPSASCRRPAICCASARLTLAAAQRVLGALAVGDVGRDADHRGRPALGVEHRRLVGEMRAAAPPVLDVDRAAGPQDLAVLLGPALDRGRIEELRRSLPTTSSGGLPTSSQAARLACTIRPSGSCTYMQHRHPVEDVEQPVGGQCARVLRRSRSADAIGNKY